MTLMLEGAKKELGKRFQLCVLLTYGVQISECYFQTDLYYIYLPTFI